MALFVFSLVSLLHSPQSLLYPERPQSSDCHPTPPSWPQPTFVYIVNVASYPSSPVTIQRHRNPRTVLHRRTGRSSMKEPQMIDQHLCDTLLGTIMIPMSTSSPLSWTLPVTVPPTVQEQSNPRIYFHITRENYKDQPRKTTFVNCFSKELFISLNIIVP